MMKFIYIKALERCFQLFFLWLIFIFSMGILALLIYSNILANIALWSFIIIPIFLLPLVAAYLLERQKRYYTKNSTSKQLSDKCYNNLILVYSAKLLGIMCNENYFVGSGKNGYDSDDDEYNPYYKPKLVHLFEPLVVLYRGIINARSTKSKQNPNMIVN